MSFSKAKKAFKENGERYLSAKDGASWNTNAGLLNLTEAIASEMDDLQRRMKRIEQLLSQLAQ